MLKNKKTEKRLNQSRIISVGITDYRSKIQIPDRIMEIRPELWISDQKSSLPITLFLTFDYKKVLKRIKILQLSPKKPIKLF